MRNTDNMRITFGELKKLLADQIDEDCACAAGCDCGGCDAAPVGDAGASAPIGSVSSILTGGKPAYDYVKNGEPILGPGDFVMPGGYMGRTKKSKRKFPINKEFKFDHRTGMDESTKITLTVGQLKSLMKEDTSDEIAKRNAEKRAARSGKFDLEKLFPAEKFEDPNFDGHDCAEILDGINPKWDTEVQSWLEEEEDIEGQQTDVDDWDVWRVSPGAVIGEDAIYESLYDLMYEFDNTDEDGMADVADVADEWLERLSKKYEDADLDDIESAGTLVWKGRYRRGGYYPDA